MPEQGSYKDRKPTLADYTDTSKQKTCNYMYLQERPVNPTAPKPTHSDRKRQKCTQNIQSWEGGRGEGGGCHFKLVSEKDGCPPSADTSKLNNNRIK